MANPSGPITGTDLGPVADGTISTARKVQPDNAQPVVEDEESATQPPSGEGNGASQPSDAHRAAPSKETAPQSSPPGSAKQEAASGGVSSWPAVGFSTPHQDAERSIYDAMKTKYGAALVTDVDDAQLLLSYVTRNGLQDDRKIPDNIIQTLIESREQMRAGAFDAIASETKFRSAYGAIAKAAQPVNVASLRDSLMLRPYRPWWRKPLQWFHAPPQMEESRPIAEIACLRYRNFAFCTLIALILIQSYWTAASSILSKTDALIAETAKARREFAQQSALVGPVKGGGPGPASSPAPSPATETTVQPVTTNDNAQKTQTTLEDLVTKASELEANYAMLATLMAPLKWLESKKTTDDRGGTTSDAGDTQDKPKTPPGPQPPEDSAKKNTSESLYGPNEFQTRRASTRAVAGQMIDVMQKWLLPLLYGALGAMVFVVRTLSMQARDRLFRKEAQVSLVLRVFLGSISGLAIGWFWTHDSSPATANGEVMSLSTLSPFALAFIAGYGVELFFALLDKIIATFTNKSA
jgi:hypothetical protein